MLMSQSGRMMKDQGETWRNGKKRLLWNGADDGKLMDYVGDDGAKKLSSIRHLEMARIHLLEAGTQLLGKKC
jgi:hypothetical protein